MISKRLCKRLPAFRNQFRASRKWKFDALFQVGNPAWWRVYITYTWPLFSSGPWQSISLLICPKWTAAIFQTTYSCPENVKGGIQDVKWNLHFASLTKVYPLTKNNLMTDFSRSPSSPHTTVFSIMIWHIMCIIAYHLLHIISFTLYHIIYSIAHHVLYSTSCTL